MDYLKYWIPRVATQTTASQTQTTASMERKPDGYKNISTSSVRPIDFCFGDPKCEKSK